VTGVLEALAPLVSAGLRILPIVVLGWLALFFGRTLRAGATPLIERVARIGKPSLSAPLCRYARGLTALWCAYFAVAAVWVALAGWGVERAGVGVVAGSAVLFVGEHCVRRLLFPGEWFPGLVQQVRDTVQVWRPRGGPQR
jgi:uncharacterized membrane protein